MAARGRGRGRGQPVSFNIGILNCYWIPMSNWNVMCYKYIYIYSEQLGIGRGADAIPTGQTHPPPLFPPLGDTTNSYSQNFTQLLTIFSWNQKLENRPLPISRNTVEEEYILVVQKDFITRRSTSTFFLKPNGAIKRDNQQFPVG